MTRKEIKELLPILQAFAEGKTIECSFNDEPWAETNNLLFCDGSKYRIKSDKSEPKYRAFKNQEECWNEMHKHPDFGWVKNRRNDSYFIIARMYMSCDGVKIMTTNGFYTLTQAFEDFTFADGTPFGIKEE